MIKVIRIALLKRKARKNLERYRELRAGFGCGVELFEHICKDAMKHRQEFEKAISQLRQLDPSFPR